MRIGDLRHRVEIGRYAGGKDQWGDPIPPQWQPVCIVWAAVEALGGRLYFEAQQTAEQSDHKVTIRYRKGIEPGMVIRLDAGRQEEPPESPELRRRELVIQAVLDREGRRRWLELVCREVRPA